MIKEQSYDGKTTTLTLYHLMTEEEFNKAKLTAPNNYNSPLLINNLYKDFTWYSSNVKDQYNRCKVVAIKDNKVDREDSYTIE